MRYKDTRSFSVSLLCPWFGRWAMFLGLLLLWLGSGYCARGDGGLRQWEWLGPGNVGGRVRAILIHPTNSPLRMLAASPGGGIWLSTNSGASWNLTDGFLPSLVVGTLSMCASNPAIIYAGTGESFANGRPSPDLNRGAPGAGVYKSINGGNTWTQLVSTAAWNQSSNRFVNCVAVHPTNENLVLAATDLGLQRSTNGGNSWQLVRAGRVTEVQWVTAAGQMVAGLQPSGTPSVGTDLVCALYSTNNGLDWSTSTFRGTPGSTTLTTAAPAGTNLLQVVAGDDFQTSDFVTIGTGSNAEVRSVSARIPTNSIWLLQISSALSQAHAPNESVVLRISQRATFSVARAGTRIYAALGAGGGTVWRSDDGGRNFDFISNPNANDVSPPDTRLDYNVNRAFYNHVIWAGPRLAPDGALDVVVVGGGNALRSLDNGTNFVSIMDFSQFNEGLSAHSDFHAIVAHPAFPSVPTVYFGNDGGIQAATNILTVTRTNGWTNLAHGLGVSQFWAGKVSPDGQWFFGCGQDAGVVMRGPGNGINNWFIWTDAADSRGGAVESNPPGGSPFLFYNATSNLQLISNNVPGAGFTLNLTLKDGCDSGLESIYRAVALDPNNPANVVAGGNAIWRSTNRGSVPSWSIVRDPLSCTDSLRCSALAVAHGNSSLIWAGYGNGRLSHTSGSVTNWVDVLLPDQMVECNVGAHSFKGAISDILIDPNNTQRVFITFVGSRFDFQLVATQTVFVTTNSGACWTPLMGTAPDDLPPTVARAILMNPGNQNWLYVATDQGVYASEDGGQTWSRTPMLSTHEGPYNVMVSDLDWHAPDYLVASTYGLGMHRARAPVTIYVDKAFVGQELGTQTQPFNTVAEANGLWGHGSSLSIKAGTYDETGIVQFDRRGFIRATGGVVTIR
jgi:hypothetical protein